VSGGLVTYPNGAVVPLDPANQAATAHHLAAKGYGLGFLGYAGHGVHYIGKREADAEADASLVAYPNGALVPFNPALHGYAAYHGVHYIGKREADAEADASLVSYANGALVPYNPYLHGVGHVGYHYIGKREAEAEAKPWLYAGLGAAAYGVYAPVVYAAAYTPLVAHPNGALVPVEPADVVQARADHLAAKVAAH